MEPKPAMQYFLEAIEEDENAASDMEMITVCTQAQSHCEVTEVKNSAIPVCNLSAAAC